MKRVSFALLLSAITLPLLAAINTEQETIYGFIPASSRVEREWEDKLRAVPNPQILRDTMKRLSARPHHVGSPQI